MLKDNVRDRHSSPSLEELGDKLHSFACDTGLIVRRTRSFSAEGFLLSMLKAVCSGNASFNRIACSLSQSETRSMSRQAVHSRMKAEAVGFLDAVLDHIVRQRIDSLAPADERIFRRILIQDSTQFKMHRGNHQTYPSLDNNSGRTAGVKIDMKFDVVTGRPLTPRQSPARTQDKTLGPELIDEVEKGDLVIRDMGYFALQSFIAIASKGAWWISRLHGLVEAKLVNGTTLEDHLAHGVADRIDVPILLGKMEYPARLIATRVPVEVAARRRAARREKSSKQGHKPSVRALTRDDWTIHVTNLDGTIMSAEAVASAYRLRWEIEIKFRAWKQSSELGRALSRISNEHHLRALVTAAMIYFVLTLNLAKDITDYHPGKKLSFEKVCTWISESLLRMTRLEFPPLKDLRYLMADRRKRSTLRDLYHSLN